MAWDDILTKAVHILEYKGELTKYNLVQFSKRYEDEKMVIEGILPLNYLTDTGFWRVTVKLKFKPRLTTQSIPYAMPKSESEKDDQLITVLFFSKDARVTYARPGRWCKYLSNEEQKIQRDFDLARKLDNQSIDDEKLFPDLRG